ncbi:hypothetical protein N7530_006784 [Penicillium desertorum]|uniref:Uncharacterized protein n=1 Tax=Penicillium desertorum TaxID=1303715 RepID=A0A9W9WSD1_9EURO|nr:hypothetical protein N7530_006784 [Penicillium desertorum]
MLLPEMEYLRETLGPDAPTDLRAALKKRLENLSELEQLDTVTQILMSGTAADEKLSELIFAAWEYLCEQHLWSFKFESLEQYRQLISYRDTVKPIIQRFKKSDRIKVASVSTIEKHWQTSIYQAIPKHLAPQHWSKPLLFLLSSLSKHKSRDDAIALLKESIHNRPTRSRQKPELMASDVERVLKSISISNQYTTHLSEAAEFFEIGQFRNVPIA